MIDRSRLRSTILDRLQADFEMLVRAAQLARDEATNEESRAEGKYDTRAQEAAYLAEGQARAASELQASIAQFRGLVFPPPGETAAVGHFITVGEGKKADRYLLGPRAGGLEITLDETTILIVTPASPLGRQLLGARIGKMVTLPGRPPRVLAVTAID